MKEYFEQLKEKHQTNRIEQIKRKMLNEIENELAKKNLDNLQDVEIIDSAMDEAYYVEELYELLEKKNIFPVIKMRKDASNKEIDAMHKAVREMESLRGYKPWRDKYKCSHRWNIEGYNSSTKRTFGECVHSHKEEKLLERSKK